MRPLAKCYYQTTGPIKDLENEIKGIKRRTVWWLLFFPEHTLLSHFGRLVSAFHENIVFSSKKVSKMIDNVPGVRHGKKLPPAPKHTHTKIDGIVPLKFLLLSLVKLRYEWIADMWVYGLFAFAPSNRKTHAIRNIGLFVLPFVLVFHQLFVQFVTHLKWAISSVRIVVMPLFTLSCVPFDGK